MNSLIWGGLKLKVVGHGFFIGPLLTNYFVMILAIVQRMFSLVHLMKFGARGFGKHVSGFKIIFSLCGFRFLYDGFPEKRGTRVLYTVNKLRSHISRSSIVLRGLTAYKCARQWRVGRVCRSWLGTGHVWILGKNAPVGVLPWPFWSWAVAMPGLDFRQRLIFFFYFLHLKLVVLFFF